ncbi:hypothetical protein MycrhDRAFT_2899 [Mycolicibacterium rhodesiae JS60]|nr:hypothetical protein MycrhDRAFT_2899 [Mycolicibacterium rhodesiae JS60]
MAKMKWDITGKMSDGELRAMHKEFVEQEGHPRRRSFSVPDDATGVWLNVSPEGAVTLEWGDDDGSYWHLEVTATSRAKIHCDYPQAGFLEKLQRLVANDAKALDASFDIYWGETA